jgi:hypothetical protein
VVAVHRVSPVRPVLVVLGGFAIIVALLAWSRWLAGRRWAAAGHLLLAVLLGVTVALSWPLARHVETYDVRVPERPVAEVFFERIGPSRFRVAVTRVPAGRMQVVELTGDEWRLDLTLLDWGDGAVRLGARPRYRIEAVVSRAAPATAAGLTLGVTARLAGGAAPSPWLATLGARKGRPLIATRPLSGPWLPMANGARFDVRTTADGGVEVDPRNIAAGDSLAAR